LRYEVVVIVVLVRVTTACGGSGRYHLLSDRFKEVWASQKRSQNSKRVLSNRRAQDADRLSGSLICIYLFTFNV
jgi:hypothetical protein